MLRRAFLALCGIAIFALAQTGSAQKFQPKSIQFKGAPEYSDEELLAAAGLKKGVVLDYAEMNDHSKRLMDSGMFASLAFKFDGQDLIFTITPETAVYPIHLVNLPLTPGAELDAQLHETIPLYHGKVPGDGGLVEDVRAALERILAGRGVTAKVSSISATSQGSGTQAVVAYTIPDLQVHIGDVQLSGVSEGYVPFVQDILKKAAKMPFATDSSAQVLERSVELFYQDRGYAAVKVNAAMAATPVVSAGDVQVPFAVTVTEGRKYTIGTVTLPTGALMTQADVEKILTSQADSVTQGVRVRTVQEQLSLRYHAMGYLDCKVNAHPTFDDAAGTANYTFDIDPGPVYHLGFVKFDNVSDQLRSLLMRYWQMMPGDVYDETYAQKFLLKAEEQDAVLRRTLSGVNATVTTSFDKQAHQVNLVFHLSK
jgi:outer membrane protein assembly factor BamA